MDQKKKLLKDLTSLYQHALAQENLTTALKALDLKARLEGFYVPRKMKELSLKDLSDNDIETLLDELIAEGNA